MPTILRTPVSRSDVVEIVVRIRRVNARAARKVLVAINDAIVLLSQFPGIGPARPELGAGIRSFPVAKYTDYLIFYRLIEDGIEVIRVVLWCAESSEIASIVHQTFRNARRACTLGLYCADASADSFAEMSATVSNKGSRPLQISLK